MYTMGMAPIYEINRYTKTSLFYLFITASHTLSTHKKHKTKRNTIKTKD